MAPRAQPARTAPPQHALHAHTLRTTLLLRQKPLAPTNPPSASLQTAEGHAPLRPRRPARPLPARRDASASAACACCGLVSRYICRGLIDMPQPLGSRYTYAAASALAHAACEAHLGSRPCRVRIRSSLAPQSCGRAAVSWSAAMSSCCSFFLSAPPWAPTDMTIAASGLTP